jgi:UDP-GlcNAc:undecaprenyl-phosphate GlcNAc-1-phosphate transferase
MPLIPLYLLVALTAFLVSWFATPPIIRLAVRWGAIDRPGNGKIHTRAVPRLGGVAVVAGFLAASLLACLLSPAEMGMERGRHYLGIILGGAIIVALGIYDDRKGAKAPVKFVIQILAALVLVGFGYGVEKVTNPLGGQLPVGWWGVPLIVGWIVLLTNALNLIDGLDGLAGGVAAIAGIILFFAAFPEGPFVPLLALSLVGACLGFLRYNFFPARIFLGDTGSLFLGFLLAALSIQGSFKTTAGMALALPLVALLIPLADTVTAFFRRLLTGHHPFAADQRHVHHRLLAMGYSQTQAVLLIYALQINLGVIALVLKFAGRTLAVSMLILLSALMFVFFKLMERFRLSVSKIKHD